MSPGDGMGKIKIKKKFKLTRIKTPRSVWFKSFFINFTYLAMEKLLTSVWKT